MLEILSYNRVQIWKLAPLVHIALIVPSSIRASIQEYQHRIGHLISEVVEVLIEEDKKREVRKGFHG